MTAKEQGLPEARELLAAELDAIGFPSMAAEVRDPEGDNTLGVAMVRVVSRALAALASDTGERGVEPWIEALRTTNWNLHAVSDLADAVANTIEAALRAQPAAQGGGDTANAPGSRAWMHDVVMAAAAHLEVEGRPNAHLPKIAHWILAALAQPDGVSK